MDIWSKGKRSLVMSRIGSKNTKPEIALRSTLFKLGYRFRIHRRDLPGKPDIVFPTQKVALFVHGCFWHFHKNCNEGRIPSTNSKFWATKFKGNIERDERHQKELKIMGWTVIVIWECEIEKSIQIATKRIENAIRRGENKWNTRLPL